MNQTARDSDTSPEPSASGGGSAQRVVHAARDGRDSVSPALAERLDVRMGPATTFATTEHFNLQTARAITVAEANGRASIYLAALSTNLIALAFIGQMSRLGAAFYAFAPILPPVLAPVRVVTFLRLVQSEWWRWAKVSVLAAVAGLALAVAGVEPLAIQLAFGAAVGTAAVTTHQRNHRRARDAYSPEGVDRAAIFVPPSPQADTA